MLPPGKPQRLKSAKSLKSLALPTEARQTGDYKDLAPVLGKSAPFEMKGLSGVAPKPGGHLDTAKASRASPEKVRPAALAGANRANSDNRSSKNNAVTMPAVQGVGNLLRALAHDVRRIGRGHRCDAESIAIDKDCIAMELGRLAGRLDRRATR